MLVPLTFPHRCRNVTWRCGVGKANAVLVLSPHRERNTEARIAITLLGPMALEVDGQRAVLPGRKARALLAYLALRLGDEVTRETLCGLAWGDRPDL
jgi:hypothetical protein